MFINNGNQNKVDQIIHRLKKGDETIYSYLVDYCTPREVATALTQYLMKHKPLLPERIQMLLVARNDGVTSTTIALDALGLLFEEFSNCTNLKLIHSILDIMKDLSTKGQLRPTEMRVSHAPYIILPLFFDETVSTLKKKFLDFLNNFFFCQRDVLLNWKKVCDTLHEMIMLSHLLQSSAELSNAINENKQSYDIYGVRMNFLENYKILKTNQIF